MLPILAFISVQTRLATYIAAIRRGWVIPIIPGLLDFLLEYPASYKNYGTYVLLPEPVSPHMTVTKF